MLVIIISSANGTGQVVTKKFITNKEKDVGLAIERSKKVFRELVDEEFLTYLNRGTIECFEISGFKERLNENFHVLELEENSEYKEYLRLKKKFEQ